MAIPLLGYPLNTQNGRVSNLAGDNSTITVSYTHLTLPTKA